MCFGIFPETILYLLGFVFVFSPPDDEKISMRVKRA